MKEVMQHAMKFQRNPSANASMRENLSANIVAGNTVRKKDWIDTMKITVKLIPTIFQLLLYSLIFVYEKIQFHAIIRLGPDGSLVHRCDCCTIYFKTTEERDAHSQTAHKEKAVCKICNQTFRSLFRLQQHDRSFHAEGKPKIKRKPIKQHYFCAKCGEYRFIPTLTKLPDLISPSSINL